MLNRLWGEIGYRITEGHKVILVAEAVRGDDGGVACLNPPQICVVDDLDSDSGDLVGRFISDSRQERFFPIDRCRLPTTCEASEAQRVSLLV